MKKSIPRSVTAVIAVAVASTVAWTAPPAAMAVAVGNREVQVPLDGDVVAENFTLRKPDGTVKLFIPKGFPRSEIPADMDAFTSKIQVGKGDQRPKGPSQPIHDSYEANQGHWTQYMWNNQTIEPQRRLWVFDRMYGSPSVPSYSYWAWDFAVNEGIRNEMKARGLSERQTPIKAYYKDDNWPGSCQKGGWWFPGMSFVTICNVTDMSYWCNRSDVRGCAWTVNATSWHNGKDFQPTVLIRNNLDSPSAPIAARNTIYHELIHALGLNHNLTDTCSLMWERSATCDGDTQYKHLTNADLWQLANMYAHPTPD